MAGSPFRLNEKIATAAAHIQSAVIWPSLSSLFAELNYFSDRGTQWLSADMGLAVTSHAGPFITATARMSGVESSGDISPTDEFIASDDIGFQMIALPLGGGSLYPKTAE